MINVNELEARWFKYKLKFFIPHIVILLSITIISAVFFLFNTKSVTKSTINHSQDIAITKEIKTEPKQEVVSVKVEKKISIEQNKTQLITQPKIIAKEIVKVQPIVINKPQSMHPYSSPKNTLSPSLDFMAKIQGNTLPYFDIDSQNKVIEPSTKLPSKASIQKVEKKVTPAPIQQIVKKSSIQIDRQNTHDDINQVIKRFKKNNNPALSLFIAKKYYQLEEYHQSYNYSLMTNEIDNNIEASWIIFAKSLVKLNEKNMAIETLNKYISHSNSHRARILLDNIKSGKFR